MPPKSSDAARVSTPLLFPITSATLVSSAQTPRHLRPFFTAPLTLLIFSYDFARQSKGWSFRLSPPYHLCLPVACARPTTANCSNVSFIPHFSYHTSYAPMRSDHSSRSVSVRHLDLRSPSRPSLTIVIREPIKAQDVPRNLKGVVLREPSCTRWLASTKTPFTSFRSG
jgi:hypothetical protein